MSSEPTNNNTLLQACFEKAQPIADLVWQTTEVEPDIEGGVRDVFDFEPQLSKTI